jgi:hypothetical protein
MLGLFDVAQFDLVLVSLCDKWIDPCEHKPFLDVIKFHYYIKDEMV